MNRTSTLSRGRGGAAHPTQPPTSHPPAFWFFFWGELAERCSYYGMRVILPLYLTTVLNLSATAAGSAYSMFKMACYLLPLLGGFLADRYLGKYWTIVGFAIPYVGGHFVLGLPHVTALTVALVLLAMGSGVIKPNISTLMGMTYDQQRPGQRRLRAEAFLWFYFAINVGSTVSMLVVPIVRNKYGYQLAFQIPAWLMVISLTVFALGKRYYAVERPAPPPTPAERVERRQTLSRLFGVFALVVFFWVGYELNDSVWVFFARDYVDLSVPGWAGGGHIAPDQLQVINPVLILVLVPAFGWAFRLIDPEGRRFPPTRRMFAGFAFATAACGLMTAAGFLAGDRPTLSPLWLVIAYALLTVGEILVYGTGLELAYTAAPESAKGFVTACFLVTVTAANFVNAGLIRLYGGSLLDPPDLRGPLPPGPFFAVITGLVLAATLMFPRIARRLDAPARS